MEKVEQLENVLNEIRFSKEQEKQVLNQLLVDKVEVEIDYIALAKKYENYSIDMPTTEKEINDLINRINLVKLNKGHVSLVTKLVSIAFGIILLLFGALSYVFGLVDMVVAAKVSIGIIVSGFGINRYFSKEERRFLKNNNLDKLNCKLTKEEYYKSEMEKEYPSLLKRKSEMEKIRDIKTQEFADQHKKIELLKKLELYVTETLTMAKVEEALTNEEQLSNDEISRVNNTLRKIITKKYL